jgi:DNA polymerase III subunit epsilon
LFSNIADEFVEFITGAELVIHNAPFDLSFINNELMLIAHVCRTVTNYCRVIDTLKMARQLHVGQRNSLDALCKRYGVDASKRDLHGALLDANLLAQVYLAMTVGQGSFFDSLGLEQESLGKNPEGMTMAASQRLDLIVSTASEEELNEHNEYLQNMKKAGKCLWLED